jgi:DNA-binding transcriptional regulator YdaS (Cro superfamily)
MDLLTYIADTARRRALATAVNSSPDYLWQVATGRRKASTDLAKAIDIATGGEVSRASLRSDVWDEPAAA